MKHLTRTIVSGCLFVAAAGPALGQAEEDPRQKAIEEQIDRAVKELFQDIQLQELEVEAEAQAEDEPEDPRDQIIRDREREEAFKKRLLQLQLDQQRGEVIRLERAAEPIQLDAEPYVDPWADRARADIVAALDHADYAVRESAETALLMDNTLTQAALKALIQAAQSPEQRKRLLRVAEHHVLRELRDRDFGDLQHQDEKAREGRFQPAGRSAAVGYSYEPVMAQENPYADLPGVRVIATMPGFPGHAYLKRGDIIVQINGQGLSRHHREHDITNWVRWQISTRAAGDTISFTVLRGGELLAIELVCAQGQALDHMYTTDAFEAAARKQPYRKAWQQAREDLMAVMPEPKTLTPKVIDAAN